MKRLRFWLILCLFPGVTAYIFGLDIKDNFQNSNLSKHMYILRDSAAVYDIQSFYSNLDAVNFTTTNQANFVENFSSDVYWLYIPINYKSNYNLQAILEIINPDLNEIKCFFYRDKQPIYVSQTSGDSYQFSTREIEYKNFIYPIDFDSEYSDYELILRINSAGETFICPIHLSEKAYFYSTSNLKNFGSGIYYCLLTIFIISLFVFYKISKEKMILYYLGYLVMLVLYLMDIEGLTNQYISSRYPFFQSLEQPVLAGLLSFFFLKFSNRFFNFKENNRNLHILVKWASIIIIILVMLMPLILNLPNLPKTLILYIYLLVLLVSSVSIYIITAIKSFRFKEPKYYLFAITFGIEAIGFCIHFLSTHGILPDYPFTRNILFYVSLISLSYFTIYLIFLIDNINSNYKALQLQLSEQKDESFKNIMKGEEIERARISKILESKIAARLNKSREMLVGLSKKLRSLPHKKKLADINEDINLALQNLESVNLNIAPHSLNKEGFKKTIERDLNMVANTYKNISFEFTIDEIEQMGYSEFDKSVLYRIFEETLNNAIKHSQASKIDIYMLADDEGFIYEIEDNGIGIQDLSGKYWGMGMQNIKARVSYLNGNLNMLSHPGKGTQLKVVIPPRLKTKLKIA